MTQAEQRMEDQLLAVQKRLARIEGQLIRSADQAALATDALNRLAKAAEHLVGLVERAQAADEARMAPQPRRLSEGG